AKWDAHADGATDVVWHAKGELATAGRDGRVKVWDAKGKSLAELGPAADAVLRVGFTADAKTVAAADWSAAVRVWPAGCGPDIRLSLPVEEKPATGAVVPVATPAAVPVSVPAAPARPAGVLAVASSDLARKRAALKAVEDAAEKLKEEAARNPKNP